MPIFTGYEPDQLFIGGRLQPPHSQARLAVINPATEEQFGSIIDGDEDDVDTAVRAAQEAAAGWAARSPKERADHVRRFADLFEEHAEEISQLVSKQNGSPISAARAMQAEVPKHYRYFASLGDNLKVEEAVKTATGDALVRRLPVGVAALITPWNGPHPLLSWKLGPSLVAGCTSVIKPAAETSLDTYILADLLDQAGIPEGVVNIVTGGRDTGAALVAHPGVRKVAFTGSTAGGRAVAQQCAKDFKRLSLELGGKSAAILLEDVDLDAFRPLVMAACTPNTGQVCRALTRVLAPASRYDEIVAFLAETMLEVSQGDPSDPTVGFGPVANATQHRQVLSYIDIGVSEGAELVIGGGRPAGLERGYYVEPTIFRNVTNDMRIAREEIFGPVITVSSYETVDEAVAIANDSDYGLGGGVFSQDKEKASEVARRVETGAIGVNTSALPVEAPFGGVKNSGIGRELGPGSLDAYLEYQTIFRA